MNIITMNMIDPVTGKVTDKDEHLFDTEKVVHSKDDARQLNKLLSQAGKKKKSSSDGSGSSQKGSGTGGGSGGRSGGKSGGKYGISVITGKPRTSSPDGFKVSAKCRPDVALGHNNRDPAWVKNRENVDPDGYHKTYIDCQSVEKAYAEVFDEYVEEYNSRQTRNDRKIKDYYKKLLQDGRNGTMKKSAAVDTHRKPVYEFIFQVGKRDHRLDTETSIKILEKFSLEYMPQHFPNLRAVGIYLHADEFTLDPVTKERLEGAVHVHFDYIPVAHALTKEELEEEKQWRKELEQQAREEAKANGEKFSRKKFDEQDWSFKRAQKFGKALQNGMLLQSSISGACAEMGFRTKGKLTAQIQMEEAVRTALLDFAESYGVKVNRDISEEKQEAVHIDEYKVREDNKRILEEIKVEVLKNEAVKKENQKTAAKLARREEKVKNLEAQKADVEKREKNAKALETKVAPYVERINTLVQDESNVRKKNDELSLWNDELEEKASQIEENEKSSLKEIERKQTELDSSKTAFEKEKTDILEIKKQNEENQRINSRNERTNERNAEENRRKADDFYEKQYQYRMMKSVCSHRDETAVNLDEIGEQLKKDLTDTTLTWREAVDRCVETMKVKYQQVLLKFKDAVRGFKDYLEGKTASDFRKLADDMDRNQTRTFEEYEKKHMEGKLDWQVKEKEEKYTMKPLKKEKEVERD